MTSSTITGQLQGNIFISKGREEALKVKEEVIDLYRIEYNILYSDGLLEMREDLKNGEKEIDQTQFLQFHQTNLAPKDLKQIIKKREYIWKTCS